MNRNLKALQLAVLHILDRTLASLEDGQRANYGPCSCGDWSVQGFGVLRLYIRKVGRLHIWDSALRYPRVSMVHNHSWDLHSTVVSGHLINSRFEDVALIGRPYLRQRLLTGYDARMIQPEPEAVRLLDMPKEIYWPGDEYKQAAHEIHRTDAKDGTITLMARNEDVNGEADVFWQVDETWGTATPRRATPAEIEATILRAMPFLERSINGAR